MLDFQKYIIKEKKKKGKEKKATGIIKKWQPQKDYIQRLL